MAEVSIVYSEEFRRNVKRLAKKYPSMANDLLDLKKDLKLSPFQGTDLGGGKRKVRMAIASKGKGKSGGARVITFSLDKESDERITITLLTIYDKSEISNLSDHFVDWLISQLS